MQQSDLITSAQAAVILEVDRGTFNRWAAKGLVPIVHNLPGRTGSRLFHREDILKLHAERQAA